MAFETSQKFRLSHQDKAKLEQYIDKLNSAGHQLQHRPITISSIMRASLHAIIDAGLLTTDQHLSAELRASRRELRAIGNNLNQLAHAYNAGLLNHSIDCNDLFSNLVTALSNIETVNAALLISAEGKSGTLREHIETALFTNEPTPNESQSIP